MGVCSRPRGRGPRPPRGQPPSSAYSVPNHSHFGSPGPHPGPRGGSTSDILDTGFNIHGLLSPCGQDRHPQEPHPGVQVFARAGSDSVLKFLSWFVIFVLFWHAFFSGTGVEGFVSLCSPNWSEIHYVVQAGLKLTATPPHLSTCEDRRCELPLRPGLQFLFKVDPRRVGNYYSSAMALGQETLPTHPHGSQRVVVTSGCSDGNKDKIPK